MSLPRWILPCLSLPDIEAQIADGSWKPVAAEVGAPAGKTKTILVDLQGKLPPGCASAAVDNGI